VATYGDINFRLAKEFPGVDPDIRAGIINDRYTQILLRLPWSRLDTEFAIQTVAKYETGTVAIAAAGTALTLTGGTWTSAMTGRQIHIAGRNEYYTFTYVSPTTATIDRAYEGDAETAAGYTISQSIVTLPANTRLVRSLRNLSTPVPIEKRDRASGDITDPSRNLTGPPVRFNNWMDSGATPPPPQIELWPSPDRVYSIAVSATVEQVPFGAADTGVSLLPWARPMALMAGCRADLNMLPTNPNLGLAEGHEGLFEKRLAEMVNDECRRQGGSQMNVQSHYTKHRLRRWAQTYRDTRQIL
jgi:hypothetical protein